MRGFRNILELNIAKNFRGGLVLQTLGYVKKSWYNKSLQLKMVSSCCRVGYKLFLAISDLKGKVTHKRFYYIEQLS